MERSLPASLRRTFSDSLHKRRAKFSPEEDEKLRQHVLSTGSDPVDWRVIADALNRTTKQVRERWMMVLSPDINKAPWTPEEMEQLFKLQQEIGNRWSVISTHLPGRPETACKNAYYASIRRKQRLEAKALRKAEKDRKKVEGSAGKATTRTALPSPPKTPKATRATKKGKAAKKTSTASTRAAGAALRKVSSAEPKPLLSLPAPHAPPPPTSPPARVTGPSAIGSLLPPPLPLSLSHLPLPPPPPPPSSTTNAGPQSPSLRLQRHSRRLALSSCGGSESSSGMSPQPLLKRRRGLSAIDIPQPVVKFPPPSVYDVAKGGEDRSLITPGRVVDYAVDFVPVGTPRVVDGHTACPSEASTLGGSASNSPTNTPSASTDLVTDATATTTTTTTTTTTIVTNDDLDYPPLSLITLPGASLSESEPPMNLSNKAMPLATLPLASVPAQDLMPLSDLPSFGDDLLQSAFDLPLDSDFC